MDGATLSEGRGPLLLGITWTLAGIATLLYVSRAINASVAPKDRWSCFGLRWDFVWVSIAYVTAMCAEGFITVSVLHGTGNHQYNLSPTQAVSSALWSWIGQVCAVFALVWGRFAVIAFLMALQGETYMFWKRALWILAITHFLINITEVGLILNQCQPVQKLWDQSVPGTCNLIKTTVDFGYLQGSIGAFTDFFLALYPPAVIIGPLRKMAMRLKIGLCCIMMGGIVAGIAGAVKTACIASITRTQDISFDTLNLLILVLAEMWLIIIFGSLPTITALRAVILRAGRPMGPEKHNPADDMRHRPPSYLQDPSWLELSGNKHLNFQATVDSDNSAKVRGPASATSKTLGHSDSEEEIFLNALPPDLVITKTTTMMQVSHPASSSSLNRSLPS